MALLAAALVALPAIGCDRQAGLAGNVPSGHGEGRLQARPEAGPVGRRLPQGLQRFGPGQPERGILYVSRSYSPARLAALVLVLHGAGGNGVNAVKRLVPIAERSGAVLLGVKSLGPTWDYVLGGYGPDVAFVDRALERVCSRFRIDPSRVGVSGFSDGATYSLSLGVTKAICFATWSPSRPASRISNIPMAPPRSSSPTA